MAKPVEYPKIALSYKILSKTFQSIFEIEMPEDKLMSFITWQFACNPIIVKRMIIARFISIVFNVFEATKLQIFLFSKLIMVNILLQGCVFIEEKPIANS